MLTNANPGSFARQDSARTLHAARDARIRPSGIEGYASLPHHSQGPTLVGRRVESDGIHGRERRHSKWTVSKLVAIGCRGRSALVSSSFQADPSCAPNLLLTTPKLYSKKSDENQIETVKARYLIGCDGAHSWTRRQLGIKMIGDQTNFVWGVLDMIPLTNFPDIRMRCAVHSANAGSVMVIPQPKGLVRLYIQLPIQVKPGEYLDRSQITPDSILSTARKILHPYTLETEHIEWYTGYHIGQRMTESFGRANRIFLAGDACHTHSPKAGQGMNTSMQDTWNLCWKLGSVLTGTAEPNLLETYATEREVVARTLIDFDTQFSRLFSGKPASDTDGEDGVDLKQFKDVFAKSACFLSVCRVLSQLPVDTKTAPPSPPLSLIHI